MKLLFIQGGSRVRECNNKNFYVDGNFDNDIWKRYKSYCDELTVILRKVDDIFDEEEIKDKLNKIDTSLLNLQLVDDIYFPKKNFFDLKKKKNIRKIIKEEVKLSDKIVIRSIGNFYTNTALKYCQKYKKEYLIEVTGFAFEGLWYHSVLGKMVAIPREIQLKKSVKKAPYVVYVTNEALQKRYPCKGETVGCSDVEIKNIDEKILNKKIQKLKNSNGIYKIGTAAFLNVKWKGQQDVIKSLYKLKKKGITNFKYELIGAGNSKYLKKIIDKYDLQNQVKILGMKKHDEVFKWLEEIDIYVQPSYQEGLCRSIVEAMSMACPVIASDVGGNFELIDKKFIFKKGNVNEFMNILENINNNILIEQSRNNFLKSQNYYKNILDEKRNNYYKKFIGD